ncbi:MAG: glycosyltransferase [Candidatus Marinimicrobia bacterium]|nr:glycosyltransferase [Candidatus Neomarinimicrobiota bacterium]
MISVILPVYNAQDYLKESIDSIRNQSYKDFELIIIDDGSTDNSMSIIESYKREDTRIRFIRNAVNRGNYPSRNHGISLARGEFIAVMDSDDIALADRFEIQLRYLQNNKDVLLIGSQVLMIDPQGNELGVKGDIPIKHDEINEKLLSGKWAIIHPSVMMRKDAVEKIGGYREKFRSCADHDLYLQLSEIGKVANLPDILLKYRQHYSSMTMNQTDQQYNLYHIKKEARNRRGLKRMDDESVPEIVPKKKFSRKERMEIHYQWGKIALKSGKYLTAMKHLGTSIRLHPYSFALKGYRFIHSKI